MSQKNSVKNQVTMVRAGVSACKEESSRPIQVDYDAIARAIADNDLHHQEETGNLTGLHLRHCTILVQRLAGNKYRGWDTFGWTIWIKPKHR
jgi:hypothetical protein